MCLQLFSLFSYPAGDLTLKANPPLKYMYYICVKLFIGVFCIFEQKYKKKEKHTDPNSHREGQSTLNDSGLLTSQSWPEAIVIAVQKAV